MMTLHVYEFEPDYVIAESVPDAVNVYREYVTSDEVMSADELEKQLADGPAEIPDDQRLSIYIDERDRISDDGTLTNKPCGEWAAERGRGFLCTTEW